MIRRQCIKEIYREIEVCSECGEPMEIEEHYVLTTWPPQYQWKCKNCNKVINSFCAGTPHFVWRETDAQ